MYFSFIENSKIHTQTDLLKKGCTTFIHAATLMAVVQVIIVVIAIIISPYTAAAIPYYGSFQLFFERSEYMFAISYIIYMSIAGGLVSCLTMCIYEWSNNSALAILIPSFGITTYIPSSWLWGSLLTTIIPDAPLSAGNYFAPTWKRILDLIIMTVIIVVCISMRKRRSLD